MAARALYVPFVQGPVVEMNFYLYVLFGVLVIVGASNAVNLTDGLDGLASGCMTLTAFSFLVLALIVGDERLSSALLFHHLPAAGQMAVFAGAILGACMGFLWFNCNPARVFMGDTGSLALGGLIGYIAIVIRQELMLLIIGGIFAAEAISVILQVGYFKYTRKRYGEGRRIFLMSPLHHHFQKKGWTETQVVTRFWIVSAMLTALALATIKLR
jgi:phospho-N-acetylmuramoyl-pentapeptide-transferase